MSDGEQFPLKPASNDRMCVHTITWEEGDLCCQGAGRVCFHLNSTLGLGVGRTGDIQGGARNDGNLSPRYLGPIHSALADDMVGALAGSMLLGGTWHKLKPRHCFS